MKTLLFIVLAYVCFFSDSSHAQESRYRVTARCFVVNFNADTFQVINFGRKTGRSNYDCANARDNLDTLCDSLATQKGYASGSVFKDIMVKEKSSSKTQSAGISISDGVGASLLLLGVYGQSSTGVQISNGSSQHTSLDYIQVTDSDCRLNKRVPQEDEPSIQDSNLGT